MSSLLTCLWRLGKLDVTLAEKSGNKFIRERETSTLKDVRVQTLCICICNSMLIMVGESRVEYMVWKLLIKFSLNYHDCVTYFVLWLCIIIFFSKFSYLNMCNNWIEVYFPYSRNELFNSFKILFFTWKKSERIKQKIYERVPSRPVAQAFLLFLPTLFCIRVVVVVNMIIIIIR